MTAGILCIVFQYREFQYWNSLFNSIPTYSIPAVAQQKSVQQSCSAFPAGRLGGRARAQCMHVKAWSKNGS